MSVLITGSQEATPAMLHTARRVVAWAHAQGAVIVVGDARGVDAEVRRACARRRVAVVVYGGYGKIRGACWPREHAIRCDGTYLERDRVMAESCDLCVAIKNLASKTHGTDATAREARQAGKRVMWRACGAGTGAPPPGPFRHGLGPCRKGPGGLSALPMGSSGTRRVSTALG